MEQMRVPETFEEDIGEQQRIRPRYPNWRSYALIAVFATLTLAGLCFLLFCCLRRSPDCYKDENIRQLVEQCFHRRPLHECEHLYFEALAQWFQNGRQGAHIMNRKNKALRDSFEWTRFNVLVLNLTVAIDKRDIARTSQILRQMFELLTLHYDRPI